MSKGSIRYEIVKISTDDLWKYDNTSHKSGENFAKVWYLGSEIDASKTYSKKYQKENGIGDYCPDGKYTKAEENAKKDREKSKDKKSSCSSCSGSLCDSIIDSIPGLRCLIDCCC